MDPAAAEHTAAAAAPAPPRTYLIPVRDDAASRGALAWAVKDLARQGISGDDALLILLHVVSQVPNKDNEMVQLSRAEAPRVARHIYKTVLPFLDQLSHTFDTDEIPTEVNVVKSEAKGQAILEEAKKLLHCTVVLGRAPGPSKKDGTVAFCTAAAHVPQGAMVCVIEGGAKVTQSPLSADLLGASPSSVLDHHPMSRSDDTASCSEEGSSPGSTSAGSLQGGGFHGGAQKEGGGAGAGGVLQQGAAPPSSTWAGSGAVTRRARWLNSGAVQLDAQNNPYSTLSGILASTDGESFRRRTSRLAPAAGASRSSAAPPDPAAPGAAAAAGTAGATPDSAADGARPEEQAQQGGARQAGGGAAASAAARSAEAAPGEREDVRGATTDTGATGAAAAAAAAGKELTALELARLQYQKKVSAVKKDPADSLGEVSKTRKPPLGAGGGGAQGGGGGKAALSRKESTEEKFWEYSREELNEAMFRFKPRVVLGEGSFGVVYKGLLRGAEVAIKKLKNPNLIESKEEIEKEVEVQKRIDHVNCVRLLGYNLAERIIVYEICTAGTLEESLLGMAGKPLLLWPDRCRIAMEVASGLLHLHSRKPAIVHRDVKPANVLLDGNLTAKLGDVGLARLMADLAPGHTHVARKSVRVGTQHYVDPEYLCARRGYLGPKSDVFSFGIVLLQMLVGGIPNLWRIDMAVDREELEPLLDPRAGDWPIGLAMDVATLGLWCAEMERKDRPDLQAEVIPALLDICEAAAREMIQRETDEKAAAAAAAAEARRLEEARKKEQEEAAAEAAKTKEASGAAGPSGGGKTARVGSYSQQEQKQQQQQGAGSKKRSKGGACGCWGF